MEEEEEVERTRWRQRERNGGETVPSKAITQGDQVAHGEPNGD